jgi:RNA recognition motif-containing protein
VRLSDFVNAENRFTCLKMRGLPFSVSAREIRDFFEDFRVAERDITIDLNQGRPTGYALVFFESEAEAERAKD